MAAKALSATPGTPVPALDNGSVSAAPEGLVANTTGHHVSALWDIALPLVVAIALPLLLKYLLESEHVRRLLRFSPLTPKKQKGAQEDADFDFDA